jgi:hypothetical protein
VSASFAAGCATSQFVTVTYCQWHDEREDGLSIAG